MAITRFYLVVPTAAEIAAANGAINLQVHATEAAAKTAAVKSAITAGAERIVMEAISYADPVLDPATITAQIKAVTP